MSSFKNAEKAHRRTHKERGQVSGLFLYFLRILSLNSSSHGVPHVLFLQLSSRKKYGLLEKHKDYVLRAK